MTSPPEDQLKLNIIESTARDAAEDVAKKVFEDEFSEFKKALERQQALSWQIMYLVLGVFAATLLVVAVEIMLFHTKADQDYLQLQNQYFQEVKELQEKNYQSELRLQQEIDEVKAKFTQSAPSKK